jgi:DNA-binding transcriptional regulator YhcF (GntR family)
MYYRNGKTGNAFPSYDTLSELTGLSRNMISKCLRELESAGWISLRRRFNATTIYTLNFPTADEKYEEKHEGKYQEQYQEKYEDERARTEYSTHESYRNDREYDESYLDDVAHPF